MRRVPLIVCLVLAVAGGVSAIHFFRENRALRAELAALRAQPTPAEPARAEPAVAASTIIANAAQEAATTGAQASSPVPGANDAPGRTREGPRRDGERRDRGQEFFARALADPESRAAMLTRAKSQIDRRFGEYFVKLGLDETQIEALRTLLAERQIARMESNMLERAAETDQERADAQAWRESKLTTTETDINSILGADGLKNLQTYLDSAPQRQVVGDIARRAAYAGAPLSPDASERLVNTVRQVSADRPLPRMPGTGRGDGDGDDNNATRQPVTAQSVTNYLGELRARNQQIIERAREFLSQSQLEALADQQIDEIQQAEAQLNFMMRNPDARRPGGFGGGGGGRGPGG